LCLGAVNVTDPQDVKPSTKPFITKSGAPAIAVPDPLFGVTLFWGLLPDCNAKGLPANNPCVVSRSKDKATGDLLFQYQVAYPFDPNGSLG
jgi:hypothetical protein